MNNIFIYWPAKTGLLKTEWKNASAQKLCIDY